MKSCFFTVFVNKWQPREKLVKLLKLKIETIVRITYGKNRFCRCNPTRPKNDVDENAVKLNPRRCPWGGVRQHFLNPLPRKNLIYFCI